MRDAASTIQNRYQDDPRVVSFILALFDEAGQSADSERAG